MARIITVFRLSAHVKDKTEHYIGFIRKAFTSEEAAFNFAVRACSRLHPKLNYSDASLATFKFKKPEEAIAKLQELQAQSATLNFKSPSFGKLLRNGARKASVPVETGTVPGRANVPVHNLIAAAALNGETVTVFGKQFKVKLEPV